MRRILATFLVALVALLAATGAVAPSQAEAGGDPRPIACGYLMWNGWARSQAYYWNSQSWPKGWDWFAGGSPPGWFTHATGFLSNGSGWCRGSWYAYTDGRWYPFYDDQRCQFYAVADAQLDITYSRWEGCFEI